MYPLASLAHFEILSPDMTERNNVYASLFDWHVDDSNPFGYPIITTGVPNISGGFGRTQTSSGMLLHFYVEGIHEYLQRAEAAGARVLGPVVNIENVSVARFIDPCDNEVGIWETALPIPHPDLEQVNNVVGWEITGDIITQAAFYRNALGWKTDLTSGVVSPPDQMPQGRILTHGQRRYTTIVTRVDDLDIFSEHAKTLGCNLVDEDETWIDGRDFRRFSDPDGIIFAVVAY